MMTHRIIFLILSLMSFGLSSQFVPDQVIVKYKSDGLPAESHALAAGSTLSVTEQILKDIPFKIKTEREIFPGKVLSTFSATGSPENPLSHIYQLILESGSDVTLAVDYLRKQPQIEYAEPNYIAHALDVVPNDPYYAASPNLKAIYDVYEMEKAWGISTGSATVIVAVIDTGVDYNHPDLLGKVTLGYDYINLDNDPMDDHSHGTHVAGTIAAICDNGIGISGIGWNSRIYALKVLNSTGNGNFLDVGQAIINATTNNARIINLSLGGPYSSYIQSAVNYAFDRNCLVIAAAGNDGADITATSDWQSPVCNDGNDNRVLGVASVSTNRVLSSFSNYSGRFIDVCAVGEKVFSTKPSNLYQSLSGTSMATPMVSGVAALLLARNNQLFASENRDLVMTGANDINSANPSYSGMLGRGLLDAYKSLLLLSPTPTSSADTMTIQQFYSYPNPVQNSLQYSNNAVFHLKLSKEPQSLRVLVYAYSGKRLRVLAIPSFSAIVWRTDGSGEDIASWDLKDDQGVPLPSGVYLAMLEITEGSGTVTRGVHKIVIK